MSQARLTVLPASRAAAEPAGILAGALRRAGHPAMLALDGPGGSDAPPGPLVVIGDGGALDDDLVDALLARAGAAAPVLVVGARPAGRLAAAAGFVPGPAGPPHEVRLRPGPDAADLFARTGELTLPGVSPVRGEVAAGTHLLATVMMGLASYPAITWQPQSGIALALPATVSDPGYALLVHRLLRHLTGQQDRPAARVGLLGYGAIGAEHAHAALAVPGLELAAVCDRNPERVAAAQALAPGIAVAATGEELLAGGIDLVVVSTPPDSHAGWATRALAAGVGAVVEKPFCLTTAEADALVAAAEEAGAPLAVYQNRRWDPDYLALSRVARAGLLGDIFDAEVFVGGYGHPCNYWHSDAAVSGGAFFDWGAHLLDQLLLLLPQPVASVTATQHKRRWHDVTNADHSKVTVRFDDGAEATFVHSDLAAALKPKYTVLGTEGAVLGQWQDYAVVARDPVGLLSEDRLAPADAPAAMTLHRPAPGGGTDVTRLALPDRPSQPFHRELAEQWANGWPMSVTAAQARRTTAVLEAAAASAAADGRPVEPR